MPDPTGATLAARIDQVPQHIRHARRDFFGANQQAFGELADAIETLHSYLTTPPEGLVDRLKGVIASAVSWQDAGYYHRVNADTIVQVYCTSDPSRANWTAEMVSRGKATRNADNLLRDDALAIAEGWIRAEVGAR